MKFIHGQTIRTTFLFLFIVSIINIVHYIQTREQIFLLSFLTTTIASCFYLYFTYKQATPIHIRYFDWIVTTPILYPRSFSAASKIRCEARGKHLRAAIRKVRSCLIPEIVS